MPVSGSHKNSEKNYRGVTGIAIFSLGTLVLPRSFVQDQVADSSCECKFYACFRGIKYMESVQLLICDLLSMELELPDIPVLTH